MSETTDLIRDMAEKLFGAACDKSVLAAAENGEFQTALWTEIADAGLAGALLPESAGGSGLAIEDALLSLRIAASRAAPAPLAETMLAGWLAGSALAVPEGPLTIAPASNGSTLALTKTGAGWRLEGKAKRVPFARDAAAILVLAEVDGASMVARVDPKICEIAQGRNLAMEPRDDVTFACDLGGGDVAPADNGVNAETLRAFGAAMRANQIAGALSRALEITLQYAGERVQFGKPIAKFQAIQHNLAMLAAHSAAANAAADMAAEAAADGMNLLPIAAAKARCGEAASIGAGIAHQTHGAIGFTREHMLHYFTKRLWSWRDEFGKESDWALIIGRAAAKAGPKKIWSDIVTA
ncbi:MAG TPA: acyl-CoA dehydrogenase family protein, partial [Rhodoblastus sp.]|nr:acyl-CoA dehydrogenase family protein [Rhodoblastus sp.]